MKVDSTTLPPMKPKPFVPESPRVQAFAWIEWYIAVHDVIPTQGRLAQVSTMDVNRAKYYLRTWRETVQKSCIEETEKNSGTKVPMNMLVGIDTKAVRCDNKYSDLLITLDTGDQQF